MLNEMSHIPDEFLSARVEDLYDILKTPTLFHLEGINPKPLFISTLLHGNETTGFYAVQQLLNRYKGTPLPRSISLFIGNIEAAKAGQRRLDNQDDYNRIWPGSYHNDSPEKDMMQTVTNIMATKKPLASIDIHNNTGKNPHYGCVNTLNPHGLTLAAKFSDIAVYFTDPKGVQSSAFSDFCPAVVLECGQSSDSAGVQHVLDYLETLLQLDDLSDGLPTGGSKNIKLFHTIARVTIPKNITLGSQPSDNLANNSQANGDLVLNELLEEKNFHRIEPDTIFATTQSDKEKLFIVNSESHEDISEEYIRRVGNELLFKKAITLAMFTCDEKAIRQDCVCYLMEELHIG